MKSKKNRPSSSLGNTLNFSKWTNFRFILLAALSYLFCLQIDFSTKYGHQKHHRIARGKIKLKIKCENYTCKGYIKLDRVLCSSIVALSPKFSV